MSKPKSRAQGAHPPLTQEVLKAAVHYDPETGIFTWIKLRSLKAASLIGKRAGTVNALGYRLIGIDHIQYLEHRLAFLYMTGAWPPAGDLDHRDRDKANNAWPNIRLATRAQNIINRDVVRNNTTGITGVSCCGEGYRAYITVDRRQIHLGCTKTLQEASALRRAAAMKYFGEFGEAP